MSTEVTTIEVLFFAAAVLLPLVGGGTLLYFIWKGSQPKNPEKK